MIRLYRGQRRRGGANPLGVGVIATGSIYYLRQPLRRSGRVPQPMDRRKLPQRDRRRRPSQPRHRVLGERHDQRPVRKRRQIDTINVELRSSGPQLRSLVFTNCGSA